MSASPSGWAAGALLVVLGVWLLLQTLVGSLVSRVVGSFSASSSSSSAGVNANGPSGQQGGTVKQAPLPSGATATPGAQVAPGYQPAPTLAHTPSYVKTSPAPIAQNAGNPKSPPAPY